MAVVEEEKEDYTKMLDNMYAQCSQWYSLPKENIDDYMVQSLYTFGNVHPVEKARRIVAEWKAKQDNK